MVSRPRRTFFSSHPTHKNQCGARYRNPGCEFRHFDYSNPALLWSFSNSPMLNWSASKFQPDSSNDNGDILQKPEKSRKSHTNFKMLITRLKMKIFGPLFIQKMRLDELYNFSQGQFFRISTSKARKRQYKKPLIEGHP